MRSLFKLRHERLFLAACIAAAIVAPLGRAQQPPATRADEIVVTATRVPEKAADASQHVTVITAADIAAAGQQTLAELLQMRGGVEITNTGGLGQPTGVSIRGAETRHTLVLVDGLRLGSATAGSTAFENIPLSQIQRIEIVPGPLSSLYGADAIGGVIQIFTKSGANGASAKIGAGSFRTGEANAAFGRRVNDTEFNVSVGALESNAFNATKTTIPFAQFNPDNDSYRNTSFSARLVQHLSPRHELGFTAFQSQGSTHFDAGSATDDVNRQTLGAFAVYSRNQFTDSWTSLVRLGTSRDKLVTVGAFPGYFQTDQQQATWQNDIQLQSGTLVGGLEYLDQHVGSDTLYKQNNRTVASAFGGYRGAFGNHGVQLNARHDASSQFGGQNTGSLGYSYRLTNALRLRAAAGTAFKAPTFNDLYFPDQPPFFFSNPNLLPERSRSREIGVDINAASQNLAVTAFENDISNLITIVTDPATFVSTTQNLAQARIRGAELAYRAEWQGWQARVQATVQDPRDQTTGFLLRRRAQQYGSVLVKHAMGSWNLGAELAGSSYRYDSTTEAVNARLAGYGLVNLTAGHPLSRVWSVNARWNNVLNRRYELVQFYNTPRSNLFVWFAYQTP